MQHLGTECYGYHAAQRRRQRRAQLPSQIITDGALTGHCSRRDGNYSNADLSQLRRPPSLYSSADCKAPINLTLTRTHCHTKIIAKQRLLLRRHIGKDCLSQHRHSHSQYLDIPYDLIHTISTAIGRRESARMSTTDRTKAQELVLKIARSRGYLREEILRRMEPDVREEVEESSRTLKELAGLSVIT